ncbi:GspJ family type II secretion system protein [Acidobacteria bacterium AH-259-D05]|nr:GspJ family type II secretion system protein [Acidobacteria bacterium AH-259-D05]
MTVTFGRSPRFCPSRPDGYPLTAVSCQLSASPGFTLLELIIAFSILGLMATVIFSSFRLSLNSYQKSQERLEVEARKRVLQDQIKRQIGSLYPVRPSASFIDIQNADTQGQQLPAFSRIPLFYGTPDSVTFASVAPLMLQENPGLTIVRYGLAQDEFGNYFVGAMEARYLGLESFMSMVNSPGGEPLPLIEQVVDLQFQYYGYDAQSETYQWFDSWVGEEMLAVPRAIRIDYDENHLTVPINASFYGTQLRQGFQRLIRR